MSYMFTNGPFSHTGLKADFTLGGGAGLMFGIANPIDVTSPSSGSDPKTLIAQFSKVAGKASFYLNYAGYFGAKNSMPTASSFNQIGLTATFAASDKLSIGYDGTIQMAKDETIDKSKSWWASALYFNLTASDVFGVTLRTEYFSDKKYGIKVSDFDGNGSNIFASTLSGNYKVGGFLLIPELRYESASTQIFSKNSAGDPSKTAFSAILAAVYSF
jgi:Putative beta-barrel porin-2, OmpL-like. bbp2